MPRFKLFKRKKRKKYPVRRDENGRSARERCFELFEKETPIEEIVKIVGVKQETVYRYLRQHKNDPFLNARYSYARSLFKKSAPDREKNVEMFADLYGLTKEQLETILSQPHGLKRLLTGKLYTSREKSDDRKRHKALAIALSVSDFLTKDRGTYEDVYQMFRVWMLQQKQFREEEDAVISEENKITELIHKVIEVELKEEREGRVKPDLFSEEEQRVIAMWIAQKESRETQFMYWSRIIDLMNKGLTADQAREKLYQDVLKKSGQEKAKSFKEFQDRIHLHKPDDQAPPKAPQTPSPK